MRTGTELAIAGLDVGYGGPPVVDGLDLTVPAGTFTALLGPSGCGKSTLLKAVAGLVEPDAGEIRVGDLAMLSRVGRPLAAERRPVGLVFQKPLLFEHLSVGDNVGFGLRMRGVPRNARRTRVAEMLERVDLTGLAARRVGELSGGQEQRVALARALVLDPQVLLLDEPFSQLDAQLRVRVRELVRTVQRDLAITTLFVTHDRHEAMEIADAVAVMHAGRIDAHGPPAELYADPPSLRVARALGEVNALPGRRDGPVFSCAVGRVPVGPGTDGPGTLLVRPESVLVAPAGDGAGATVRSVRFRGSHTRVTVALPDGRELVAAAPPGLREGDVVDVSVVPRAGRVLPGQDDGHA